MFWILPMACGIVWSAGNAGPDDPVVILKWREGCTWTRLFSGALLRALQSYVSWKRLNWPNGERREMMPIMFAIAGTALSDFASGAVLGASVYLVSRGVRNQLRNRKKWHSPIKAASLCQTFFKSFHKGITWGMGLARASWHCWCRPGHSSPIPHTPNPSLEEAFFYCLFTII